MRPSVAGQVDLQGGANEHVAGVKAGGLAEGPVGAHAAVGTGEEDVRTGGNIVLHADFGAEAVARLDTTRFDGGNQRRMWIQRPVGADLALQAQLRGVGREQQLDGGGVEADAVVESLDAVLGVNAFQSHHRHQHLHVGDLCRVTGE